MVIDVKCVIMLFTTAELKVTNISYEMLCFCLFTPRIMFQHYHQVKRIHSRNYRRVQSNSCRLHDVPVVIINRQYIELKGLSQIVP